jgi:HAD superfamily hydrolase (TIGR01459 family)
MRKAAFLPLTDASPGSSRPLVHDRKTPIIPAPRLVSGLSKLSPRYDVLLCDVWGVVHNGLALHPAAIDALLRFRGQGGKVILVSNAPAPAGAVRYRLDRLKVPRKAYDAIVTSGDIIASLIAARGDAPLYNIGPIYDRSLYREVRKLSGRSPRLSKLKDAAYVVCTGLFDPDTETPADYDPSLAQMLERRLDFLCANPDLVVHVGPKLIYCAGAIAERYEAMGGTVIQGGKPYPPIYERALGAAEALLGHPAQRSRILVIGDAMRTDVKGAIAQSFDSLFIVAGIHQDEILTSGIGGNLDAASFAEFIQAAGFASTAVSLRLAW